MTSDLDPAEGAARGPAHEVETEVACDLCGALMYGRHCKLVCPSCGYLRDCSDP